MFKVYTTQKMQLKEQAAITCNCWVNLADPTQDEIAIISKQLFIDSELIGAALDIDERSRIQKKGDALLIIMHIPIKNEANNAVPYRTMPLGIIVKDRVVITVTQQESSIFSAILSENFDILSSAGQTYFIYRLLELGADEFINNIEVIDSNVDAVERELQRSIKNNQVFKLLDNNKSLIFFANSLKSNSSVLNELLNKDVLRSNEKTHKLLLDVMVETEQAQVMSETHNSNLRNLMDAYSAAIENNLSLLVQYLSIFVVICAVPMGIAGMYGMNTPLPLQEEPYILALLGAVAAFISIVAIILFKKFRII